MNTQTTLAPDMMMITVADLTISTLNTRQTVPVADIEALAESLCINGLIQNLSGLDYDDSVTIVAGGKRLRALQLIAANPDRFPTIHTLDPVPVRVTSDEDIAKDWAGAENEARADPHPADQIIAYRDMAARGADAAKIARAYAKPESHVRGRLALAQLPDNAISALRDGFINLDEAKALTLAKDAAQLDRVLKAVTSKEHLGTSYIRRELADGRIQSTDRRVVFVGLDTYRAEGGAMVEDLFEGNSLLHNEELLNKLFAHKLAFMVEKEQQRGDWAWVTAVQENHLPYSRHETLERIFPTPGELTNADQEEYERLEELYNTNGGNIGEDDTNRLELLQDRLDGDFTDEQRETAGVFVYVNHKGEKVIDSAYRIIGETANNPNANDTVEIIETKPKPPITARGTDDLHMIATLALQTELLSKQELLLDLLAFQMESGMYAWQAPMNIQVQAQRIDPSESLGVSTSPKLTAETEVSGPSPVEQFANFQALGKKHRNTVLARNLARAVNAPMRNDFGKAIMAMAGAEMRKVWTPTASNFFGQCSVATLDGIWAEVLELEGDDARRAEFGKLKKADKANELECLFSDASMQEAQGLSRAQVKALDAWVPEDFRATLAAD